MNLHTSNHSTSASTSTSAAGCDNDKNEREEEEKEEENTQQEFNHDEKNHVDHNHFDAAFSYNSNYSSNSNEDEDEFHDTEEFNHHHHPDNNDSDDIINDEDHNADPDPTTTTTMDQDEELEMFPSEEELFQGQHPALQNLCVMNTATHTRIVPNGPPVVLENDCFVGHVMLLVRTPDVDLPHPHEKPSSFSTSSSSLSPGGGASPFMHDHLAETPRAVSQYFRDKKRRFEFQFQIRLKHVPRGALFLGCELEHSLTRVGTITKGLVSLLLAMVRRINPGFHYSWGDQDKNLALAMNDRSRGNFEQTHLSFPVEASMDRIVITPPHETPPTLGQELIETPESVKRRRKVGVGSVDWNTSHTYTMCLWSAYADWILWKSLNVPGVAPFSLSRVTGTQPIYLSVYEITSCPANEYKKKRPPHKRKDLKVYTRLEFTHAEATKGGLAEKWKLKQQQQQQKQKLNAKTATTTTTTATTQNGRSSTTSPVDDLRHRFTSRLHMGLGNSHKNIHNNSSSTILPTPTPHTLPATATATATAPTLTTTPSSSPLRMRTNSSSSKSVLSVLAPVDSRSLPDTESVESDFETTSRITCA